MAVATDKLRLENGAKVLYHTWVERVPVDGCLPGGVVLADRGPLYARRLVTWAFFQPADGAPMVCAWPRYFDDRGCGPISAMIDYAARVEAAGR